MPAHQLDAVDEMQCWKTDECPVEDEKKFTKAWEIHSAERNPTMETHFDSEVRRRVVVAPSLCAYLTLHGGRW